MAETQAEHANPKSENTYRQADTHTRHSREARAKRLLPALGHASQDPHNTLIILLVALRIRKRLARDRRRLRRRELVGAEDLSALEDRERLEGLAVRSDSRRSSKGSGSEGQDGEGETHFSFKIVLMRLVNERIDVGMKLIESR